MHITLIGMSNIGKSHWSKKLAAERGFERIACDALIEHKLEAELKKHGCSGLRDMARWMGQPFDTQYPENSAKYVECERAVMQETIARLKDATTRPLIIDSTGSVIHTGSDVTGELRNLSRIVYFEASPAHVTKLFERYIVNPKPVIWGEAYVPDDSEAPEDALKRCYPDLLASRALRYQQLAHITIPYETHRAANASLTSLFGAV